MPNSVFKELKDEAIAYAELRGEIAKLSAYEIAAKGSVKFLSIFIIIIFTFFFLFFVFIALGFYLGDKFNSNAAGFGIIAGFYLVLLLIYLVIRKTIIEKPLTDKIITSLADSNEED